MKTTDEMTATISDAITEIERLRAALQSIRVFATDALDNLTDRAARGNLMAIRDLCDFPERAS